MSDNWSGSGYDAPASGGGGLYCRLKEKGESARLRFVSDPYRYEDVMKMSPTEQKVLRKVAWVAILKTQQGGKIEKRVVVFQAGPMVYGLIKDLAESADWGDPKLYDVTVTRTEEKGKYYTVTPHPKPIGPLSKEEQALVDEAAIDLPSKCAGKSMEPSRDQLAEDVEDVFAED